ncbi:hypothetical protein EDB85DRAFT_269677 [Lactarius pseudohatsudake]|nr:hypothetical protein EDB85DRAFT_269677 [Lactarius pseudohatsudake]
MFSFGFQEALQQGFLADEEVFFTRSLDCDKSVAIVRFALDGYFVFAAFDRRLCSGNSCLLPFATGYIV